ncbi:MAG TPA: DNA polymerase III subunit beta [Firmicutes bacterium]|nr:DNA polymerase III subunit beta [Bacillota bacterium]
MHFQVQKSALLSCINMVDRATSPNNPKEVLGGIHFSAQENELVLTANNLEIAIQTKIPCTVMEKGEAIVDGLLASALVRRLPDDNIIFELKESQVAVSAGTMEFNLNTIVADEFPTYPVCEKKILKLTDYELEHLIRSTIFASSTEEHQPIFSGILLEIKENVLQFVATDSNRLSFIKAQTADVLVPELSLIIPNSNLAELSRCLPLNESMVDVYYGNDQLAFHFDETIFTTRLIDGNFPNYEPVIFLDQKTSVVVDRQRFLQAIERAALFNRNTNIPLIIQVNSGVLEIGITTRLGKSSEQFNVEHEGEDDQAAYSPKFLLDMLKTTKAEQVEFRFEGFRQALLKPEDSDDHLYILMPVRI